MAIAMLTMPAFGQQPAGSVNAQSVPTEGAMTASYVCIVDLTVALPASSRELEARRADVLRRESELRLAELGISAAMSVTTSAELGANLARDESPALSTSLQIDAGLSYRHDAVAIARARTNLVTALRREAAQQRTDVLSALIGLSRLRAAERSSAQTALSAADAESLAAAVRQSATSAFGDWAHADSDVLLNMRELDLAAARARAAAAGRVGDHDDALAELERLGVAVTALQLLTTAALEPGPAGCLTPAPGPAFRAAGPGLPRPQAVSSMEHRLLELGEQLATAQYMRASLAPLRDLSVAAHYQQGGARILAEAELAAGRPSAGVNFRLRDSNAHNWGVGVSAAIRFDSTMGDALAAAGAQAAEAQLALHEFVSAFPARVASETEAVHTAWLPLAFAVEALSIARDRLKLADGEREVERAALVVSRSVDALEREYQSYLRALARYLGAFDLSWNSLLTDD